jgi:hypothetical protein
MLQRNFGCESDTACGLPIKSLDYATGAIENCDRRFLGFGLLNITLKAGKAKSSIGKIRLALLLISSYCRLNLPPNLISATPRPSGIRDHLVLLERSLSPFDALAQLVVRQLIGFRGYY